jgi:hypothetical protein
LFWNWSSFFSIECAFYAAALPPGLRIEAMSLITKPSKPTAPKPKAVIFIDSQSSSRFGF